MSEAQAASTTVETRIAAVESKKALPGEFHTSGVIAVSAGHAVHDTYTGFLNPLLPKFIEALSLTKTEAGLLTVFMQWPSILQPFLGYLADRVSLRPFFIMAPTVTAVAMSLLGVAPGYAVLAMLLLVAGLSSASLHAAGPAFIGHLSGRQLGRGMGFWMVGGELGRTLGPMVVVATVQLVGLKGTPWLMITGPGASVLLYWRLRNVVESVPKTRQELPLRQVLRGMSSFALPLAGLVTARAFLVASLSTYLPILITEQGGNLWLAGASLTIFQAAGVVGAFSGGALSDRLGRRRILFFAMSTASIFVFVFLGVSGWVQLIILIVLGFSVLSLEPVFMAVMQESFPENRALATGVLLAQTFTIRSLVVVALGAVADRYDMRMAFVISGVISFVGLPLIFLLPRHTATNQIEMQEEIDAKER